MITAVDSDRHEAHPAGINRRLFAADMGVADLADDADTGIDRRLFAAYMPIVVRAVEPEQYAQWLAERDPEQVVRAVEPEQYAQWLAEQSPERDPEQSVAAGS